MSDHREYNNRWHLDKRVPIALITAMTIQIVIFAYWVGGFNNRVEQLEKQMILMVPQGEKIIRLETKVDEIHNSVNEIKSWVRPKGP